MNSPSFTKFIDALDPKYNLPSYSKLKDVLISIMYDNLVKTIKNKLHKCQTVALTTDMWSSPASEGLITTTCHFVCEKELQSVVLDTHVIRGNHTSDLIKKVRKNHVSRKNYVDL